MNHGTHFVAILALSLSIPFAYAHDPKEHAKEATAKNAAPDCAAMKDMDHSKMDPNDPVMKAMMAKCAKTPSSAGMEPGGGQMKGMDHGGMQKPAGTAAEPHDHGSH